MSILAHMEVSPRRLYPLTSFSSIDPHILEQVIFRMKNGETVPPIKVLEFDENLYIVEGNYEMLSANILKRSTVEVDVVERVAMPFWKDDSIFISTLKTVGISTLFDFEGVGGFEYETYPRYYMG